MNPIKQLFVNHVDFLPLAVYEKFSSKKNTSRLKILCTLKRKPKKDNKCKKKGLSRGEVKFKKQKEKPCLEI